MHLPLYAIKPYHWIKAGVGANWEWGGLIDGFDVKGGIRRAPQYPTAIREIRQALLSPKRTGLGSGTGSSAVCASASRRRYFHSLGDCRNGDHYCIRSPTGGASILYPIESDVADVVVAVNVMEHVRKPWIWMREITRICKPGGYVITINPVSWPYHEDPIPLLARLSRRNDGAL